MNDDEYKISKSCRIARMIIGYNLYYLNRNFAFLTIFNLFTFVDLYGYKMAYSIIS